MHLLSWIKRGDNSHTMYLPFSQLLAVEKYLTDDGVSLCTDTDIKGEMKVNRQI